MNAKVKQIVGKGKISYADYRYLTGNKLVVWLRSDSVKGMDLLRIKQTDYYLINWFGTDDYYYTGILDLNWVDSAVFKARTSKQAVKIYMKKKKDTPTIRQRIRGED